MGSVPNPSEGAAAAVSLLVMRFISDGMNPVVRNYGRA